MLCAVYAGDFWRDFYWRAAGTASKRDHASVLMYVSDCSVAQRRMLVNARSVQLENALALGSGMLWEVCWGAGKKLRTLRGGALMLCSSIIHLIMYGRNPAVIRVCYHVPVLK